MKHILFLLMFLATWVLLAQEPIFDPSMAIVPYGLINSPVGEEVDKVIDNDINTKFLDFELGDGMGFTVNLGGTARTAVAMDITTANDFPVRDPINFEVLGSNDGAAFTSIAAGNIACIPDRFTTRTFNFSNSDAFLYYRINFSAPCDPSGGTGIPSIQAAEVQLFEEILNFNESQWLDRNITIFPNPSMGEFSIDYAGTDALLGVELIDVNGKRIHDGNLNTPGNQLLKISNLKSGLYFLRITSTKASITKKLLVN